MSKKSKMYFAISLGLSVVMAALPVYALPTFEDAMGEIAGYVGSFGAAAFFFGLIGALWGLRKDDPDIRMNGIMLMIIGGAIFGASQGYTKWIGTGTGGN